jgi:hypothetical protein
MKPQARSELVQRQRYANRTDDMARHIDHRRARDRVRRRALRLLRDEARLAMEVKQ